MTPPTTGPGDPAAGTSGAVAGAPRPLAPETNTAVGGPSPAAKSFNDFVDTSRVKALGAISKVATGPQTAMLAVASEPSAVIAKGLVGGFLNAQHKGAAVDADPQVAAQATQGRIAAINNGDWGAVGRAYWNDPGTALAQDVSTLRSALSPETRSVLSATNPLLGAVVSSPAAVAYVGDSVGGFAHTAVDVDRRYLPMVANLAARTPLVPPGRARDLVLNAPGIKEPFAQVAQDYKRDWAQAFVQDLSAVLSVTGLGATSAVTRGAGGMGRGAAEGTATAGGEAGAAGLARAGVPDQPVPAASPPSALGPAAQRRAPEGGVRGTPPDTSGTTRSDGEASSGGTSGIAGTSGTTSSGGSTSTGGTNGVSSSTGSTSSSGSPSTSGTTGQTLATGPGPTGPPGSATGPDGAAVGQRGTPTTSPLIQQGPDVIGLTRDQALPHASTLIAQGVEYVGTGKGRLKNKFPAGPGEGPQGGGVYYRRDPVTKQISRYAVYDKDGNIMKRVDLDPNGRHGSVNGPRVTEYTLHEGPNGIKRLMESDDARKPTPDEFP